LAAASPVTPDLVDGRHNRVQILPDTGSGLILAALSGRPDFQNPKIIKAFAAPEASNTE